MIPVARERRYLQYVADAIEHINKYLPKDHKKFMADPVIQGDVVWRLQTLADAVRNHLSDELKRRHQNLDWNGIYGFRNVAAHAYAGINLELVWEIASQNLDELYEIVIEELEGST